MLKLKQVLIDKGVSFRQFALSVKISPTAFSLLINQHQKPKNWEIVEKNLIAALQKIGINQPLATL